MPQNPLTRNERIFLATCSLSGVDSLKELARISGLREHAVRYAVNALLERGAIKPVWQLDVFSLGFHGIATYFNRGAQRSSDRLALERTLAQHPSVTWLANLGGRFQYGLALNTKRLYDLDEIFSLIRPSEASTHFDKTVRIALDWSLFTPNYLAPSAPKRTSVVMVHPHEYPSLDDVDMKIVRCLSAYPHESLAQIARRVSMTASSFSYRFSKLTEKKIIRGLMYVPQIEKLGISAYRIFLIDRGLTEEKRTSFKKFLSLCPNIVSASRCTGSWDYELRFETEEAEDVDRFRQAIYDTFGSGVDSIDICQQFKTLKWLSIPLGT
jgi:DNA-binding Lrp family transcriptional regulator